MKIKDVLNHIDKLAPFSLQEDWDNSGLQLGGLQDEVKGVVISLDCERDVIDFAKEKGANLIVNHHPLIFSKIKSLDLEMLIPSLIRQLIKEDIAVISAHTNLDLIYEGTNQALVEKLGLKLNEVLDIKDRDIGYGRMGMIDKTRTGELASYVKEKLDLDFLILYGDSEKEVNKLGLIGGSGSFLIDRCIEEKVDLLISSDIKYHDYRYAVNRGLNIFDIGHYQSERFVTGLLKDYLQDLSAGEVPIYIYENRVDRRIY